MNFIEVYHYRDFYIGTRNPYPRDPFPSLCPQSQGNIDRNYVVTYLLTYMHTYYIHTYYYIGVHCKTTPTPLSITPSISVAITKNLTLPKGSSRSPDDE